MQLRIHMKNKKYYTDQSGEYKTSYFITCKNLQYYIFFLKKYTFRAINFSDLSSLCLPATSLEILGSLVSCYLHVCIAVLFC